MTGGVHDHAAEGSSQGSKLGATVITQRLIGKYSQPVSLILHPLAEGLPGRAQGQGAVSVGRIIEPTPCPYPLDPGIPLHLGPTA